MVIESSQLCDFIFYGNSNVFPICDQFKDIRNLNVPDIYLDLQNGPRVNLNMLIESSYATLYLIAIQIYWPYLLPFVRYSVEKCRILNLPFRICQVSYKYANGKAVCDFLFLGNSNVYPICYRLRKILIRNMHDLDHGIQNWPRSNVYGTTQKPLASFYLLAIAMFASSVTACEIFLVDVHDLDLDLQNDPRSNVNIPIEKPSMRLSICWQLQGLFYLAPFAR